MPGLVVVVLAAGKGKRMKSALPKVLHELAGRPLLSHVLACAQSMAPDKVVVVHGHGGDRVRESLSLTDVTWVEQREQLGTGHAVDQAMTQIADGSRVLVLYGDVPLIQSATLTRVIEFAGADSLGLVTIELDDPAGYGRIVRDAAGRVLGIVEEGDATSAEKQIHEVNTGILAVEASLLRTWLHALDTDNAQGELYLTDIIALAVADGVKVETAHPGSAEEVLGVNDRDQLAHVERFYQHSEARRLMLDGVTLRDPRRFDVRGEVIAGRDIVIDVNVILEGCVRIGDGVRIGPHTVVRDSDIGAGTQILANCHIEGASIGAQCRIGPYSRVRPGAGLAAEVHIGNFVEVKNSRIEHGSKVNHLSYVGDADIGHEVNVGAGTITCNYDGANKHRTVIGDNAFIGSGTELVAPVTVAAGATIGAGSTITRDAPAGELTLERARQTTVKGWKRPEKE